VRLSILTPGQKALFINLAHNVVVSDGEMAAGEAALMDEMRREMALPDHIESQYVDMEGVEAVFDSRRSRVVCMIGLLRLAYADGAFEIEEQGVLTLLATRFEIADADFRRIENWVRRLISLEKEVLDFY